MAEYFVRSPDSENARGPFSMEKLQSLAEVGQVDKSSLYYDSASEKWKAVGENEELCTQLFPQKKKLTLRKTRTEHNPEPEEISKKSEEAVPGPEESKPARIVGKSLPTPSDEGESEAVEEIEEPDLHGRKPALREDEQDGKQESPTPKKKSAAPQPREKFKSGRESSPKKPQERTPERGKNTLSGMEVEDLLVAAEGDTEHLHQLHEEKAWRERAVALSIPIISSLLLLSGVSLIAGKSTVVYALFSKGWGSHLFKLFEQPMLALGFIDLFLALAIALAVTSLYPVVRLRLMFGLGYLGWISFAEWVAGSELGIFQLAALCVFSAGLYICTITIKFTTLILAGICALAGVTALGLVLNYPDLFF
jgi:hypothetical protein